jgi:UDP-2-acetamido-3-amino-2,3-dideoxy-glucuronate N-acetyltransferase
MSLQKGNAPLGAGSVKGEYCVIEDGAVIGKGCVIGHHVVIRARCRIGENVRIDDFADIGKLPMKAANSAVTGGAVSISPAVIGDGAIIGTSAIVYAGCQIGESVLIADLATVREDVEIGEKTIIGRGAAIENRCKIGAFCKIETNAYITAYSVIEDYCFIAPGVITSNDNFAGRSEERFKHFRGVTVKRGGRIGAGAVILPGKTIEAEGFAAAGSVVTKDVEAFEIVAGNPAKKLRPVPNTQHLR